MWIAGGAAAVLLLLVIAAGGVVVAGWWHFSTKSGAYSPTYRKMRPSLASYPGAGVGCHVMLLNQHSKRKLLMPRYAKITPMQLLVLINTHKSTVLRQWSGGHQTCSRFEGL